MWEKFPELTEAVRRDHIEKGALGGSHDFLHALMVAQYGVLIVDDDQSAKEVWVAGIIHNTDRLFSKEEIRDRLLYYLLDGTEFSMELRAAIFRAVLEHSGPNEKDDSDLKMALMDADRLANIGPNMVIRSGQHYHLLPAYDPRFVQNPDPRASYKNPMTALHDIRCALEWENDPRFGLRLPKARGIAIHWFRALRQFLSGFSKQLQETGLLPYPFPEDLELTYKM